MNQQSGPVQSSAPPGVPPQQPHQAGPGARPPPRPEEVGRQVLAKSRDLVPALRDKWATSMREGGQALLQNTVIEVGGRTENTQNKFEAGVEDFHSSLDQMELNLKCALETTGQSQSSSRYMLGNLSYHQYIATAKQQVTFTNQIKDMLRSSAQDIVDQSVPQN